MMRKTWTKSAIVLACLAGIACAAYAQDRWRYVDKQRWDTKTARRSGEIISFWYEYPVGKLQLERLRAIDGAKANAVVTGRHFMRVDCASRMSDMVSADWLNAEGEPALQGFKQTHSSWRPTAPETVM